MTAFRLIFFRPGFQPSPGNPPAAAGRSRWVGACSLAVALSLSAPAGAAVIGYWQFDDQAPGTPSTSLVDSSGNNLTGAGQAIGGGSQVPVHSSVVVAPAIRDGINGPYVNTNNPLFFGSGAGGRAFDGWLEEIRLTGEVLTPSQFLYAVPEPTRAILLAVGLTWLVGGRRRL